MKSFSLFIAMLLLQTAIFSQATLIDSLETRLKTLKEDTSKVNFLNDMVGKYQHSNPERAMVLALQSTELAKLLNFDYGLGIAYRWTGVLHIDKSDLDAGAGYYKKSSELFKDKT